MYSLTLSITPPIYPQDFERDQKKKEKLQEINSLIMGDVRKYRIQGDDRAWESVLEGGAGASVTIKRFVKSFVVLYAFVLMSRLFLKPVI